MLVVARWFSRVACCFLGVVLSCVVHWALVVVCLWFLVVCCFLFVVCRLLFGVWCLVFGVWSSVSSSLVVGCCLFLFVVECRYVLFVVGCVLFVGCWSLRLVCCWMSVVRCSLVVVCCMLFVCWLLLVVWCV